MNPAFDCDGTVLDTLKVGMQAAEDILALFGDTVRIGCRADMVRSFGRDALIERFGPTEGVHIASLHPIVMRDRLRRLPILPFAGIPELLSALPTLPSIITASYGDGVTTALGELVQLVAEVSGRELGTKTNLLRAWAARTPDPVYVCDTVTDLQRCRSIGLSAFAVGWGYDSPAALSAARWGTIVATVANLAESLGVDSDMTSAGR